MYLKLDTYFNFSAFDLEVKAFEVLKYILTICGEKHGQTPADLKIDCLHSVGRWSLMLLQLLLLQK